MLMRNRINSNFIIKQIKNKKGFALIGTLILVFVVSTFGIALLTMTQNEIKSSTLQRASKETFYIAESGIDHAISHLESLGTPDFPNPNYLTEDNEHFIDLGNGKYKASIQSAGTFSYIIISEGQRPWSNTSGKISKNIESKVILENFAMYAYFTNNEYLPAEFGGGGNTKIWFYGDDHIRGPVHSNNRLHIAGEPTFDGTVSSAWEHEGDVSWEAYDAQTDPNFNGSPGFKGGVDEIPLPEYRNISDPTDANSLQRIAAGSFDLSKPNGAYVPTDGSNVTDGIWVKGDVNTLSLGLDSQNNSKITIEQTGKTTRITKVETPVTYGGTTYPSGTTLVEINGVLNYYNGYTNGVLYVDGKIGTSAYGSQGLKSTAGDGGLKGKLTIASDSTIAIGNNLLYNTRVNDPNCFDVTAGTFPDIPDSLGLVSEGKIMIKNNAPSDIEINAIIMALGDSFYYEGWEHNMQGDLTFHGSLIQEQRGPVGTFNSWGKASGYTKQYYFDTRMSRDNPDLGQDLPPYFPTTGKYIKLYWKEL
jgi:hypothetical protein